MASDTYNLDGFRNKFVDLQVHRTLTVFGDVQFTNNANMNLNGGRITGGGLPVGPNDLTTKRYVDVACGGLDYKESARITTASNIVAFKFVNKAAIENVLDTVGSSPIVLEVGDRVLVKDQIDLKENGIYQWDRYSGLIRSDDMDGSYGNEVSGGNICFIEEGDLNASTGWMVISKGVKLIGTDNIEWTRIAGPGTGGVSYLNDLLDVSITSAAQDHGLVFMTGTNIWQNKQYPASYYQLGMPSDGPFSGGVGIAVSDSVTNALKKIDDYIITNTGGVTLLNDLSDVDVTGLARHDILVYNDISGLWENKSFGGSYVEVGASSDGPFSTEINILSSDTIANALRKLDYHIVTNLPTNSDLSLVISDVSMLISDVSMLISDTASNTSDIASNSSDIVLLISDVASNTSDISILISDVASNTSDIASNSSDIVLLISDVASHTSDIAMLISDVAANTSDIASLGSSGISEVVSLIDNTSTQVSIVNTNQRGSFMLLVKSVSDAGASAIFAATSGSTSNSGNVARIVNSPSLTDEEISAAWPASDLIKLYHNITKTGGVGNNIDYEVKIFNV